MIFGYILDIKCMNTLGRPFVVGTQSVGFYRDGETIHGSSRKMNPT